MATQPTRQDIYTRVTNQIAQQLEKGVRPWMKPWSVEHTAGRITRPLRHNAIPYRGVNVLLLNIALDRIAPITPATTS